MLTVCPIACAILRFPFFLFPSMFKFRLAMVLASGLLASCSFLHSNVSAPVVTSTSASSKTAMESSGVNPAVATDKPVLSEANSPVPLPDVHIVTPILVKPSKPTESTTTKPIKIALALGGGAARGFAHIGVIKALEAQGIEPDMIAGTSAGSVVGAFYASGLNGFELQKLATKMDEATIADWVLPFGNRGVLKGEALQDYVNKVLKNRPIQALKRPLGIVATDLQSGLPVLFQRGNTGMAVRASSSVPGVFQPVRINGRDYVDGGLVAPVPVRAARKMGADFVIAVDISSRPDAANVKGTMDTMLQTFTIMGQSISQYEIKEADIVIRPLLNGVAGTDFTSRNVAVLAGEQATAVLMKEIKEKLAERQAVASKE